jgi:hypothetical protein
MLIRALGSGSFLEFCSSFSDWVEKILKIIIKKKKKKVQPEILTMGNIAKIKNLKNIENYVVI